MLTSLAELMATVSLRRRSFTWGRFLRQISPWDQFRFMAVVLSRQLEEAESGRKTDQHDKMI
jgi:hypothetical protein